MALKYLRTFLIFSLFIVSGSVAFAHGLEVEFKSHDGFLLKAKYYSKPVEGPGILLLHQCDREEGAPTGFENLAELLADNGFKVLDLDSRGYGKSVNKEFTRAAWKKAHAHNRKDVEAAYQFLMSQSGVVQQQIAIAGASCGARKAILLAAEHPEVKTLVFLSGAIGGESANKYQALTHLPVLCIVSEEDQYGHRTIQSMKDAYTKSKNEASKLLLYSGPYHGTPLFEQNAGLEKEIVKWFKIHLFDELDLTAPEK